MEFNRRILASIVMIGLLCAGIGVGTMAYFSDTEKLTHGSDVLTMGILDISLDKTTIVPVVGMVPCETKEITFTVQNWDYGKYNTIPVDVWVRIADLKCAGGYLSEPEIAEEGSVPRDYLAPYVIYDLRSSGTIFVNPAQEIRVDNVQNYWIYVGQIPVGGTKVLTCSFHLAAWTDAAVHEITNWAQGDTMNFDIEVYATQVGAPGPNEGVLKLESKDPLTWEVLADGASGILDIKAGTFTATGLAAGKYELIYYADPWPGDMGSKSLGTGTVAGGESLTISVTGLSGIPVEGDKNFPVGGKIWLVLDVDYDSTGMVAWRPGSYLFEEHLIKVP